MFLVAISVIVRSFCLAPVDLPDKPLRYQVPELDLAPSRGWRWRGRGGQIGNTGSIRPRF
jgi:hypothetical protein